jgi:multicomponent Na+:H+ antiporter subunit D
MLIAGVGLLTPLGLAATAVWVAGHALVKGSLFLGAGIIIARLHSVDELHLFGRGRELRIAGGTFLAGGLALAGLPPFLTYFGKGLAETALAAGGVAWFQAILITASVLTGGAVLRAGLRIFYGVGDAPGRREMKAASAADEERSEERRQPRTTPAVMLTPTLALLALGLALGVWSGMGGAALTGAAQLENHPAYVTRVLGVGSPAARPPPGSAEVTGADLASGAGSAAGAALVATLALYRRRLPRRMVGDHPTAVAVVRRMRMLHDGHVGDYVAWIILGTVAIAIPMVMALR